MDGEINHLPNAEPQDLRHSVDKMALNSYFKSLANIIVTASKDGVSYATFSPILKERMAPFKTTVDRYKDCINCCYKATALCVGLLKTFLLYDAESAFDFYGEWVTIATVFSPAERADTFIKRIDKFKCVVDHFENVKDRWSQLKILPILRLYTKGVSSRTMRQLQSTSDPEYLQVIHQIVRLSHRQETSVKSNGSFISSLNKKNGSIFSFQPYKIVFNDEKYVLTDYDLWIDFDTNAKVISFVAVSSVLPSDDSKNICGWSSSAEWTVLRLENDDLFILSMWCLSKKDGPQVHKSAVRFCFSNRILNDCLRSNVGKVFQFVSEKSVADNVSKVAIKSSPDSAMKVAGESAFKADQLYVDNGSKAGVQPNKTTRQSIDLSLGDLPVQPTNLNPPSENRIVEITEGPDCQVQVADPFESQSSSSVKSIPATLNYFAGSSFSYGCEEGETTKIKRKRRSEEMDGGAGIKPFDEIKRMRNEVSDVKTACNEIESLSATGENRFRRPSVERATYTIEEDGSQRNDDQQIRFLAKKILMAADDVINALQSYNPLINEISDQHLRANQLTEQESVKKLDESSSDTTSWSVETDSTIELFQEPRENSPYSVDLRMRFDEEVYKQKWSIKRFVKNMRAQPDYGSYFEENVMPFD